MLAEDLVPRPPQPFVPGPSAPLDCFGPFSALPSLPAGAGWWSAPSPRPAFKGDLLRVHVTLAPRPRLGTVVLVPPWKIRGVRLLSGYLTLIAGCGFDVWLTCPPHHLARTAPGARSGEGLVSLDVGRLRGTIEGMVLEVRALLAAAGGRGGEVGLVGLSMVGLAAGIAATAREPLGFLALVAPADLACVLDGSRVGHRYQVLARAAGAPIPDSTRLAPLLAPFYPGQGTVLARRVFLACGAYDAVTPPRAGQRLGESWGAPLRVYPRGHLSLLFLCRALRRDLARFVRGEELP